MASEDVSTTLPFTAEPLSVYRRVSLGIEASWKGASVATAENQHILRDRHPSIAALICIPCSAVNWRLSRLVSVIAKYS